MKKIKFKLPKYEIEEILQLSGDQQMGWSLAAFNVPDVWNITQGEGSKIAVLDSGCDLDHPDLIDNLLPGINFINLSKSPQDDNNHGSHSTGIIVAENNDIGMIGVAPKAKVIPVKVLDDKGSGDMENVVKGIRWAVDNGADIISMSLGCPRPIQNVRKAIQYAESKGIPVFCAAGNAGKTNELFYPANYKETISVGSIDSNLMRSNFSNTGENLDFMAPGGKIFSTIPDNWYGYMSGTSMACPFVVGIAALCLSYQRKKYPNKPLFGYQGYVDILKKHVVSTMGVDVNNKHFYEGYGIIDVKALKEEFSIE